MSVALVYAVFVDAEEAARIGRAMVDERLAACINILGPVTSIYRWEGEVGQASEVAAIFKTAGAMVDRLIVRIAELHSYDVPCIASWPVDKILASYADWAEASATG